jgi:cell division transport system ATP-binding protein
VGEPEILLADEPTGNLDSELSSGIIELMMAAADRGTAVIVATHDRSLLARSGGRVLRLENGGVVESQGDSGARG